MYQLVRSDHLLCCHINLSRPRYLDTAITDSLGAEASMEEKGPYHVHVLCWGIRYYM
jgi:hypothetical protein